MVAFVRGEAVLKTFRHLVLTKQLGVSPIQAHPLRLEVSHLLVDAVEVFDPLGAEDSCFSFVLPRSLAYPMGRLRLPKLKSRLMLKSHLRLSLLRQSLIHKSLQNRSIPLGLQIDKNMELGRPALSRGTFFYKFNLIPIHHLMHPPSLPATIQAHL